MALSVAVGLTVWTALRFSAPRPHASEAGVSPVIDSGGSYDSERWREAIEKAKADRLDTGNAALNIPAELQHYEDRHWFLATQVAEVKKNHVQPCQDFVDLAAMIQRGEMVAVPAVTDDFVLMGIGAKADNGPFTRSENDDSIPLYGEQQLADEYARLESARAASPKLHGKQRELESKQQSDQQPQSKPTNAEKPLLDKYYGDPSMRQRLFADYRSLESFAGNFRGHSYNLQSPDERQSLKIVMLSSLRPQALKVLQEVAKAYRLQFDRPLAISSLVRPEQYQHTLRRFNRAATTIETPPHSTGLAFDIDYRYMSVAEQNFVMAKLARLKDDGRIEVLRERYANFHVFVFTDGVRPNDDLIAASLQEAGAPPPDEAENNQPEKKPAKTQPPKKIAEKSQRRIKRR